MHKQDNITRNSLVFISLILLSYSLYFTKELLVPFVFSVFIFLVITPIRDLISEKTKFKPGLSTAIIISFLLTLSIVFSIMLYNSIRELVLQLNDYQVKIIDFGEQLNLFLLEKEIINEPISVKSFLASFPVFSYLKNISRYTIDIFSNILLISLLSIFLILSEPKSLMELDLYKEIRGKISLYMNTKTILSALTGIITFVICLILNIESAFLISVLTFLLNFIPTVGSIVATAIPIPIILLQYGLDFHLPVTLGLLLLTQFMIGNVIETKVFGDSLGIHPFLIFFSLAFWGFLWGISGMFLSIPLALLSKLLFDQYKIAKAKT